MQHHGYGHSRGVADAMAHRGTHCTTNDETSAYLHIVAGDLGQLAGFDELATWCDELDMLGIDQRVFDFENLLNRLRLTRRLVDQCHNTVHLLQCQFNVVVIFVVGRGVL
jgi:hypothetical protein